MRLGAWPAERRPTRRASAQPDGQVNGERDGIQRHDREDRDDHRCRGGVAVIVTGAAIAFVASAIRLFRRESDVYRRFRQQLGQAILLGLELLVAGDIVRTVAASPTLTSVAILAAIVLIRTFLSFSLEVETTGRWPWQRRKITAP
jgi:uncharacterized membrane protein